MIKRIRELVQNIAKIDLLKLESPDAAAGYAIADMQNTTVYSRTYSLVLAPNPERINHTTLEQIVNTHLVQPSLVTSTDRLTKPIVELLRAERESVLVREAQLKRCIEHLQDRLVRTSECAKQIIQVMEGPSETREKNKSRLLISSYIKLIT